MGSNLQLIMAAKLLLGVAQTLLSFFCSDCGRFLLSDLTSLKVQMPASGGHDRRAEISEGHLVLYRWKGAIRIHLMWYR